MLVRLAIALSLVAACTSGGSPTGIEELSCPPGSTLTYESFGEQVISDRCMSCHNRESPQLGTQAQVQAHASEILAEAVYTDAMPESGTMALEERRRLGEWLACGAP